MDVQEFKELIELCSNKYKHFKDDFDMVFNSIGDFTEELGWMKEELKIANPSMLRSLHAFRTFLRNIPNLNLLKNIFNKFY
ncbi:MAG TPA: hypothetical protein ENI29_07710 [bacterium]|nr:hypothetical protein [bacterium]